MQNAQLIESESPAPTALLSDESRYLDSAEPQAFADLYFRYRESVQRALESNGLDPAGATHRVSEVFVRMMDRRSEIDRSRPLSETLSELARAVALETLAALG